jgi:glycosyltransferase involved in cell wall biosynthesis
MHIGLLHESDLPPRTYGGIERIVVALARAYIRRGHTVTVLCRSGDPEKIAEHLEDAREGRLRVNKLPSDYRQRPPKEWLPKLDFLHSHQPLVFNGSDEFRPPMPFLVTIHGNGSVQENYWRNTAFLSQSHAANHSAKYFVYNGVDPSRYEFQSKKEDYFVFLARTSWRVKNVKTAIAWANDLGLRLEIMGGSGVSRGSIRYNGLVDEAKKVKLLAGARALIYPTNWNEPCAGAPLEALACGTPVIATANGCMPELVRSGTGVICRTYQDLLASAEMVKQMKPAECRKSVETFFSDERMSDDYLALFEKVMKMGDLDHEPRWRTEPQNVELMYKPTLLNRLQLAVTGKI